MARAQGFKWFGLRRGIRCAPIFRVTKAITCPNALSDAPRRFSTPEGTADTRAEIRGGVMMPNGAVWACLGTASIATTPAVPSPVASLLLHRRIELGRFPAIEHAVIAYHSDLAQSSALR
jgi:hypothetical protein